MSKSSKKKSKVPKITEAEYEQYVSAIKQESDFGFKEKGKEE